MNLSFNPVRALLLGTALAMLPAAASAQDANTADNVVVTDPALGNGVVADDTVYTNTTEPREDDDDDFPWGLLGLLGLAGLLGRKRGDDARDVHVDARRDTRS